MTRLLLWAAAAITALAALPVDRALAERRVALIIGNSSYQNVASLPNTINDANAIAAVFRKAGFDVVEARQNLGVLEFKRAVREFMTVARGAETAVMYFAGHGIEVAGSNYLIPVDAKLATDFDAEDEAVSLDRIILALEPAKRLRLVILDACRDNPFLRKMQRTVSIRAISSGLGKIEPMSTDTLIAYAAKAGSVSYDGDGPNSPFTTALIKYIAEPGLDIRIALGRVRDDVLKTTGNQQEPFVYGSLGGTTVSLVPLPEVKKQEPRPVSEEDVRRAYELTAQIGSKEAWESFLKTFHSGFYAELAKLQIAKLNAAPAPDPAEREAKAQAERDKAERLAAQQRQEEERARGAEAERAKTKNAEAERTNARAEQERAERLALQQRQEDERRTKAAEAERAKARAEQERAERLALQQRQEEERRAKAAEAERAKARAEQERAERLALQQRQEDERRAKAEAERLRAQQEAKARADRERAERLGREQRQEEERRAKSAEAERLRVQREAALRRQERIEPEEDHSCAGEERRLEQLRANPARDAVVRFARDLNCVALRPQVNRLVESVGADPSALAPSPPRSTPIEQQAQPQPAASERRESKVTPAPDSRQQACKRDEERLTQLRADPAREAVARFARELSCEDLRPQVQRLLESVGG